MLTNCSPLLMITETFSALPSDTACSLCGADVQSPDFRANEHGENLCGRGTISCSLCSKTFALWSHYETHKKCHQKSKQRQYPCQTCSKVLNLSIEIVSSQPNYVAVSSQNLVPRQLHGSNNYLLIILEFLVRLEQKMDMFTTNNISFSQLPIL